MSRWLFLLACLPVCAWSAIENSTVARMDLLSEQSLQGRLTEARIREIHCALQCPSRLLRVVSFNMLFNHFWSEQKLDPHNRWDQRLPRIIEYLTSIQPDLIGSQELQPDQIDGLMEQIGDQYGVVRGDSSIFFRRERLSLIGACEMQLADRLRKPVLIAQFCDRFTGSRFLLLNTHLSFGDVEARQEQARALSSLVWQLPVGMPIIVTGDFNSFSALRDKEAPTFLDGDEEMAILTSGRLRDARFTSLAGHFGPISSTNYSDAERRIFGGTGTPGIILDHILVSNQIVVVRHAIDSATVDGGWLSDHFPVIADLLVGPRCR